MSSDSLAGRTVLVVEDEPLIALDICNALQDAGASVLSAYTRSEALRLADHPDVAVAVLDYGLSDGDADPLCERLQERGIPFILHTGYARVPEACRGGIVLLKPATRRQLVGSLTRALGEGLSAQRERTRQANRATHAPSSAEVKRKDVRGRPRIYFARPRQILRCFLRLR